MLDDILSYRELCDKENTQTIQRGMNFHLNPLYSVVLMSRRSNAPYNDRILEDGITIEYEGHDVAKSSRVRNPKKVDQPKFSFRGNLTQNGLFAEAVDHYKQNHNSPELVKVYEKIMPGVWSCKGLFDLIDYDFRNNGGRKVFVFTLRLSGKNIDDNEIIDLKHSRLIPTLIKKEVWARDKGKCVLCGSSKNLHFDHDLPFSRGGTSIMAKNIRLLCAKCNLAKSDKIE